MQQFIPVFERVKLAYDQAPGRQVDLVCKQGFYGGCPVLKLQKAAWTNDPMREVQNKSGVFFSAWLDKPGLACNRAHYNLHALKMRELEGHIITSKDFAKDFRSAFARRQKEWPHVSVDYGPLNLMQGWIDIDLRRFERDLLILLQRFVKLSPMIDELLRSRIAQPKRA